MVEEKRCIINRDDGFVIPVLYYLFYYSERVSLFFLVRYLGFKLWVRKYEKYVVNAEEITMPTPLMKSYIFPEIWAVGNLFVAIIGFQLILHNLIHNIFFLYIMLFYAILRVFEMYIYQINVLFFHRFNGILKKIELSHEDEVWQIFRSKCPRFNNIQDDTYVIKSATRTVILLIFNVLEYIFQFTLIFAILLVLDGMIIDDSIIYNSFELFMNISSANNIKWINTWIIKLASIEVFIGLFMNIMCLARFIGLLPEVRALSK